MRNHVVTKARRTRLSMLAIFICLLGWGFVSTSWGQETNGNEEQRRKEAAVEAASYTLRSGLPPSLTLEDAGRWLKDPLRRDAALASLPAHGAAGLNLLTRWWKQYRTDQVVNQLVAHAAVPFEGESRPLFEQLIKNKKGQVAISKALSALEPAEVAHPLLGLAARKLNNDEARSIALQVLGDRQVASEVSLFRSLVKKGGPLARAAAARSLGKTGDRSHIQLLVARLLKENQRAGEDNQTTRAAIHWALGELGGPDVVTPLAASLNRGSDRDSVVAALVKVREPAVETLTVLLKGGQNEFLPGAVLALLELGDIAAPSLVDILAGPASPVRAAARDLLISIHASSTPDDIERLLKSTKISDPTDLLKVLIQYEDADVVSLFKVALAHPVNSIRRTAVSIMGQADYREMIPDMVKILEVESDLGVLRVAIEQLHKMAAVEAAEVLADLTEHEDTGIRRAAATALADVGGVAQVVALAKAAQDSGDPDVKREARRALTRISGLDSEALTVKEWAAWSRKVSGWVKGWNRTNAKVIKKKAVARDGTEIPLRIAGTSGPYVIVVHGGPDGDSRYLNPAFDDLSAGYRVVTYDLRGRDGTKESLRWLSQYRPSLDVEDIESIRRSLSVKKIIVVGHSFGSMIALAYAKTYPQHVGKLVMMNSGVPFWRAWPELRDIHKRIPEPWRSDMTTLLEASHLYPPRTIQRYLVDIALVGMVRDRKLLPILRDRIGPQGYAAPFIFEAWGEYDLRGFLAEVRMPTLLIATEGDIFSESNIRDLRAIASKNPRLRVQVIQGATHFPFIEKRGTTMGTLRSFFGG